MRVYMAGRIGSDECMHRTETMEMCRLRHCGTRVVVHLEIAAARRTAEASSAAFLAWYLETGTAARSVPLHTAMV
jgi:hypothetical protein